MLRLANIVVFFIVALLPVLAGCLTTPLPVPPNIEPVVEPDAITIEPHVGGGAKRPRQGGRNAPGFREVG